MKVHVPVVDKGATECQPLVGGQPLRQHRLGFVPSCPGGGDARRVRRGKGKRRTCVHCRLGTSTGTVTATPHTTCEEATDGLQQVENRLREVMREGASVCGHVFPVRHLPLHQTCTAHCALKRTGWGEGGFCLNSGPFPWVTSITGFRLRGSSRAWREGSDRGDRSLDAW